MTRKQIFSALDSFEKQDKYKNHEGLGIGMLWIYEFIDFLFYNRIEEQPVKKTKKWFGISKYSRPI